MITKNQKNVILTILLVILAIATISGIIIATSNNSASALLPKTLFGVCTKFSITGWPL